MGKWYEDIDHLAGMEGQHLISTEVTENTVFFKLSNGVSYLMQHERDCCESVYLEDVCGDIADLQDTKVVSAYGETNIDKPPLHDYDESYTWTFYRIQTEKGVVTFRWYGSSNGYYGEGVNVTKLVGGHRC